jgi:hypothetical protein
MVIAGLIISNFLKFSLYQISTRELLSSGTIYISLSVMCLSEEKAPFISVFQKRKEIKVVTGSGELQHFNSLVCNWYWTLTVVGAL